MDREQLRKVKFRAFDIASEWRTGYFHRWAETTTNTESGTFQKTVAIIEEDDGSVRNVESHLIKFVS